MNYGILKIEGKDHIPLEHAAFLAHVPAPYLARVARSGELSFREIKGNIYILGSSLNDFKAKREGPLMRTEIVTHERPVNVSQNIVIPVVSEARSAHKTAHPRFSHAAMSIAEAAMVAGLSANYIGKLARAGEMKTVEEHGETRIDRHSLNAFMRSHAHRLEERRAKLAEERTKAYSESAGVAAVPVLSPIRHVAPRAVPSATTHSGGASWLAALAAAVVLGSGIFMLVHDDKHVALMTSGAHEMVAGASESMSGTSDVLADIARAFNTNVNSFFASLFGKPDKNYAVVTNITPITLAPAKPAPTTAQATTITGAPAPAPAQVINQTIIQQPVIERIVQTQPVFSGVSQQSFEEQLQQLDNKLSARIYSLTSANATSIAQNYQVTAQTNAINNLNNTRITDPIITGGSITGTDISAKSLSISGPVQFSDIVFTNATTTNLAVTGNTTLGDVTVMGTLSFYGSSSTINATGGTFVYATSTNAYFTNLTAGAATTSGSQYVGGDLSVGGNLLVNGNSFTIGTSSSDQLVVNSSISSDLIPSGNKLYDLGSPSYFWRNAYIDTLNVNNLSAASSSIGGTQSETFTINTDNASTDTQDMNLVFYRGVVVPNAVISWNSLTKRFEFNQAAFFQNQSGSTTQSTLTLKGVSGQTGSLFSIASSSGATVFSVGPSGTVLMATSTTSNLSVTGLATSTFAGGLSVAGSTNLNDLNATGNTLLTNATSTSLFSTTASSTNLFAANATFGVLRITGGYLSQASSTVVGNFTSTGIVSGASFTGAGTGLTGTASSLSIGGNAGTATALQTSRTINGVGFNGTSDITIAAASSTLLANNNTFSGTNIFSGNTTFSSAITYGGVTLANAVSGTGNMVLSVSPTLTGTASLANATFSGTIFTTGLAQFLNASTTRFSSYGPSYFGATGTSTFATDGSLALGSAFTGINGSFSGSLGVGTSTPLRKFAVQNTTANAQVSIAYDNTRVTDLQTDSAGDFHINPSGGDELHDDSNMWVCSGGSCPTGTPSGTGNLIVESKIGIGTSTPNAVLDIAQAATNDGAGVGGQLSIRGTDGTGNKLNIGYNTTGNFGWIEAVQQGVIWRALVLQPTGGFVGIGTSTPTQQLSVQGLLQVGANSNAVVALGTATSTFNGDVKILGKLDVSTIDPVYMINDVKYATYGASTVGIHEEVVSQVKPTEWDAEKKMYVYTIDFKSLEQGSDLWLFSKVTDFGAAWENLVVTLTPGFDGRTFYEQDVAHNTLRIYASQQGPVSLRLIANRYDFSKWNNLRPDQDGDTAGAHVISSK